MLNKIEIDFDLLERQLENKGEFGLISVEVVLSILRKYIKKENDKNIKS